MQEGILSRKRFSVPMLRCVANDVAKQVLREVHEIIPGANPSEKDLFVTGISSLLSTKMQLTTPESVASAEIR